jgi:CRP-like cAMP-binding protein
MNETDGSRPEGSTLLQHASEALETLLQDLAKKRIFPSGSVVFREGDPGDALYLIESGQIDICVISPDGRNLTLNTLGTGDVLGEIALLDNGARTATAAVRSEATLNVIARSQLRSAIMRNPEVALEIMKLAGKRLRWVSGLLEDRHFHPLSVRLARRILALTGQSGDAARKTLKISQSELADHVGATRVAVANVIGEWRDAEIISSSRGNLTILDHLSMKKIADGAEI